MLAGGLPGAEGINSALSSCSAKGLPCCFPGGLCTPVLEAEEKSALGFSPGHLINSVELQMSGFQLLKGWGVFGRGYCLELVSPPPPPPNK